MNMKEPDEVSTSGTAVNNKRPCENEFEAAVDGSLFTIKKLKGKQYPSSHHPCPKCELVAQSAISLAKHMIHHGSNQKHACPFCDYSSKREGDVNNHLWKYHNREKNSSAQKPVPIGDDNGTVPGISRIEVAHVDPLFIHHDKANNPLKDSNESTQQPLIDEMQPIIKTGGIQGGTEDPPLLKQNQFGLEMLNKKEKSCQNKIVKLNAEIEEKLRSLEARKALFWRERVDGLMSRKVELILLAAKLDQESVEFAHVTKEEEKVEANLRDAVIKQSSFSLILEELDTASGRVHVLQPDEFTEFKNCVGALFLKLREAYQQLDLMVKEKRAAVEEYWMKRFAQLD